MERRLRADAQAMDAPAGGAKGKRKGTPKGKQRPAAEAMDLDAGYGIVFCEKPTRTHATPSVRFGLAADDTRACMDALLAVAASSAAAAWQRTLVLFAASMVAAMPGHAPALLQACHSAMAAQDTALAAVVLSQLTASALQSLTAGQRAEVAASFVKLLETNHAGTYCACDVPQQRWGLMMLHCSIHTSCA